MNENNPTYEIPSNPEQRRRVAIIRSIETINAY